MKWRISTAWVRQLRKAHSVLGLTLAAVLYVICLSGTLAVFRDELECWEQPDVAESRNYSAAQIAVAVDRFLADLANPIDKLYVVLPSASLARMHLSGGGVERYVNPDGSLGMAPLKGWTHMLVHLHNHLLLPETIGQIVTGSLSGMLCALVLNGLLSHPNLLKDLFRWRRTGNEILHHADMHNRLSVWGSPFFLMFGLTGAFFGLVGVLIALGAQQWFGADREAVTASIYGADIHVTGAPPRIDYAQALAEMNRIAPAAEPIYLMIQSPVTEQQFLEIGATLPGRLVYSEIYRFDATGTPLGRQGLSDGPTGRQLAYSVYRLHFGNFYGWASKLLYGILGLALSWVCISGVNIWLARRAYSTIINAIWDGVAWGFPTALAIAAAASLLGGSAAVTLGGCWIALISLSVALLKRRPHRNRLPRQILQWLLACACCSALALHFWRFGTFL